MGIQELNAKIAEEQHKARQKEQQLNDAKSMFRREKEEFEMQVTGVLESVNQEVEELNTIKKNLTQEKNTVALGKLALNEAYSELSRSEHDSQYDHIQELLKKF